MISSKYSWIYFIEALNDNKELLKDNVNSNDDYTDTVQMLLIERILIQSAVEEVLPRH